MPRSHRSHTGEDRNPVRTARFARLSTTLWTSLGVSLLVIVTPRVAAASWGSANWGEFVWGGGAPEVPAIGPLGLAGLFTAVVAAGVWLGRTARQRRGGGA
jgi:hypothetical protein